MGASSTESTVSAVEAVEALDGLRPSPDVLDDLADASEALREGLGGIAEDSNGLSRDGKDGFLYRLFTEALGFSGRAAIVFEPCFERENSVCLIGVDGPTEADKLDRGLNVAAAPLLTGVLEVMADTRLVGVPRTVERGGL